MICYRAQTEQQTCGTGGSICTKQFIHRHLFDEKTDLLDYSLFSSIKTIFNQTTITTTKHFDYNTTKESSSSPSLFLITVGKSAQNTIKNNSSLYHNFDKYWKAAISHHLKCGESDFGFSEPPTKIQKILLESKNPPHTKTNLICALEAWESAEETVDICVHNCLKRMNEGNENESWKTEENGSVIHTKDKCKSKESDHLEEEPPESVVSVESGANSDNSEDENNCSVNSPVAGSSRSAFNIRQRDTQSEQETQDGSAFLFLGPLGKKRRRCRARMETGQIEREVTSPVSAPSILTPECPEPPPLVEDISEDSSRSRSSGPNNYETVGNEREETSTRRSSVIHSTRISRRDDQPLNLSVPTDSQLSQVPGSPRNYQREERVSVINIISRERLEDIDGNRSPNGSQSPQFLHPQDDTYDDDNDEEAGSDFFAISSGSGLSPAAGLSPGAPSSFQGLLMAQGIMPQESGSSAQKKKLLCRDCGKEFSQLRNFKYHRSRHEGTQQFACTCPVCGKTFNDKGYLSSHLKIHRNEKEYKCEWCGKSFNQRVAYNMHIRIHTGHKPHKCNYCSKAFSRKMLLRQHIRTHTGERPYQCSVCGKAFADRSNMLLHQRLHSGERPYKCHICGKSFSKNHHLKTHLNHHLGIKPYQCSKCNATFSQSSNMKTHFRKCNSLPASSTINEAYESTSTIVIQEPSSSESPISNIPLIPQSSSTQLPPSDMSDMLLEEPLQQQQRHRQMQHEQFAGLSLPQQLLDELGNNHVLGFPQLTSIPSPLSSPTSSRGVAYRTNNGHSSQGFRSMGSSNSTGRPAMSIITSGNPSPTSLAAGHPFIPLTVQTTPHLSSSAPPPPSTYIPPRRTSTLGQLSSSDLLTVQHRSRSRIMQQSLGAQQQSNNMLQTDIHSLSRMRLQLSPTDIPLKQISPILQTQISPRQSQMSMSQSIPNYYEVLLPALSVSRPGGGSHSQTQYHPQFRPQQQMIRSMAVPVPVPQHSLTRPQDLQRIYRVQNNTRNNTASRFQQSQGSQFQSENPSLSLRSIIPSSIASSSVSSMSQGQTQDILLRDSWTTAELEQRLLAQQQQQWQSRESANGN